MSEASYTPLLRCGHNGMARHNDAHDGLPEGHPSCIPCMGLRGGACQVDETPHDYSHRIAKCAYKDCGSTRPSSTSLAFFEYKHSEENDEYYCGCKGWD